MNLRSSNPYPLLRHGIIHSYPSLEADCKTDIAIMGAGISGSLLAWELAQAGFAIVVVDRRHAGTGSTAASTSLLQYEIDIPLHELTSKVGIENATRSYLLCLEAIDELHDICDKIGLAEAFTYKPSFQFASYKKHVGSLHQEFHARKKAGIKVQWLDEPEVKQRFGFKKPAGLWSPNGAQAEAYQITHGLLQNSLKAGAAVYDNTEVTEIHHKRNGVDLLTAEGKKIKAKKLIIACGYESQKYISKKVQQVNSTYAIASEPIEKNNFWFKEAMIWETAQPYLYMRTTGDKRIIVGGKDVEFSNPKRRDRLISSKALALEREFCKLFPGMPFKTDFRWTGNFAGTVDGLPYIGSISERPNTFFALGYGGNGITFSVIAAKIIKDMLKGKQNRDASIFAFDR
ncbi:MAG: FAD-dependent oxidoreductase [Chitinophagaceae bacterium]|nr:FAD-dependent oxidoreductase [Chitinophagaceae bacterium]